MSPQGHIKSDVTDRTLVINTNQQEADEQTKQEATFLMELEEAQNSKGTMKNLFADNRPNETVQPHSLSNEARKLENLVLKDPRIALSKDFDNEKFSSDLNHFNKDSINTQNMIDYESKQTFKDPESLINSQKDSQLNSPRLQKDYNKDLKQQVQLKSHINTPKQHAKRPQIVPAKDQKETPYLQSQPDVPQNVKYGHQQNIPTSGSYIKIQTNDSSLILSSSHMLTSSEPQTLKQTMRDTGTKLNQFQVYSSLVSGSDSPVKDRIQEADESTVSLILPHSCEYQLQNQPEELTPHQIDMNSQIGQQLVQNTLRSMSQQQNILQSKSFLPPQYAGGGVTQPGSKYSKKMRNKFRKKAQQTYFSKLSQILMNQNLTQKQLNEDLRQSHSVETSKNFIKHPITKESSQYMNQLDLQQSSLTHLSTNKITTIHESTINLSNQISPSVAISSRVDVGSQHSASGKPQLYQIGSGKKAEILRNYQDRFEQYQQSINNPLNDSDHSPDNNRFIIGRKSIQTDRPVFTAKADSSEQVSPLPNFKNSQENVNKDIDFFDESPEYNRQDDGMNDSDYYNNNLQVLNHPLMQEYEDKINEELDQTRKKASFISSMHSQIKSQKKNSRQILVPKDYHKFQMASDIDKINSAMEYVTNLHIQQSLQDIAEEKLQKSEINSSKPNTAKKVIIKTNNKEERTHIDFPIMSRESRSKEMGDSKLNTKSMLSQGGGFVDKNQKTISEEENENSKYLEGSNKYRSELRNGQGTQVLNSQLHTMRQSINSKTNQNKNSNQQSKKLSPSPNRNDSEGGETLYNEFMQHDSPNISQKGTGKLMSNTKLNQYVMALNSGYPMRENTMKNIMKHNKNYDIGKDIQQTRPFLYARASQDTTPELAGNQNNIRNTRSSQMGMTAASPDMQSHLQLRNAVYGGASVMYGGASQFGAIVEDQLNRQNSQLGNLSQSVFPQIVNRYGRDGQDGEDGAKDLPSSPVTLGDGNQDKIEVNKKKTGIRRLSISNPDQININSKHQGRIEQNTSQMSPLRGSIQRMDASKINASASVMTMNNREGLQISLPELGVDLINYSQMIDTAKNSNNSFKGGKKMYTKKGENRNHSFIQISKSNLDMAHQLLGASNLAVSTQRGSVFERPTYSQDMLSLTNQKRSMKQELHRLKELQRFKEIKEAQTQSNIAMQKLLTKELKKAHNPAVSVKYNQPPRSSKFQSRISYQGNIDATNQALLLDINKQQKDKKMLKNFDKEKNYDLEQRRYFGVSKITPKSSLKKLSPSRSPSKKSPQSKKPNLINQLANSPKKDYIFSNHKNSLQTNRTTEEQKKKEQEMQYIINNITEKDVMRIHSSHNDSVNTQGNYYSQTGQKINDMTVKQLQQLIKTSGADNTRVVKLGTTEPDKAFISFSRKNTGEVFVFKEDKSTTNISKNSPSKSNQKRVQRQNEQSIKNRKRQSLDDAVGTASRNNDVDILRNATDQTKITRQIQNDTQLLMNQSSKTSHNKDGNSPNLSESNNQIENNFSTNLSSKEKLSIIRSIGKLTDPEQKQGSTIPASLRIEEEAANLKNILRKKKEITDISRNPNYSQPIDASNRHSSGSQTDVPNNMNPHFSARQVVQQTVAQKKSVFMPNHDQDKLQNTDENDQEKSFQEDRTDVNYSPHQTNTSVISQVKIYRKQSQKFPKKRDLDGNMTLQGIFDEKDNLKSQFNPQKQQTQKQLLKGAGTQFSLSPITVRSPISENKQPGQFENNGINTWKQGQQIGFYSKQTTFGQQSQIPQEYLLPKHMSQLSFAIEGVETAKLPQQINQGAQMSLNKDIQLSSKKKSSQTGKESQQFQSFTMQGPKLGDTLMIAPRIESSITKERPKPKNKRQKRNSNLRFAIKSYDQNIHNSMTSLNDFQNAFQNLVCRPANLQHSKKNGMNTRYGSCIKTNETGTTVHNTGNYWTSGLDEYGQSTNIHIDQIMSNNHKNSPTNMIEGHSNQNVQTSHRNHQSSIQSLNENDYYNKFQRSWHEDEQVNMAATSHQMTSMNKNSVFIQHPKTDQTSANNMLPKKNLSSTTTFKPTDVPTHNLEDEFYSSMEQNDTLDLQTNSKQPDQIVAFRKDTSISSFSHAQVNMQTSPRNIDGIMNNQNQSAHDKNLKQNQNQNQIESKSSIEKINMNSADTDRSALKMKVKEKVQYIQGSAERIIQKSIDQQSQSKLASDQQYDEIIKDADQRNQWLFPLEMLQKGDDQKWQGDSYQGSSTLPSRRFEQHMLIKQNPQQQNAIISQANVTPSIIPSVIGSSVIESVSSLYGPGNIQSLLNPNDGQGVVYESYGGTIYAPQVSSLQKTHRKLFSYQKNEQETSLDAGVKGDMFAITHTHVA